MDVCCTYHIRDHLARNLTMAAGKSSTMHWEELAEDKIVARVALYKPRTTWQRLDIFPFAVAYAALHAWTLVGAYFHYEDDRADVGTSFLTLLLFI